MSKIVVSPVARWPGEVVLPDPLSWDQYQAFVTALRQSGELAKQPGIDVAELDRVLVAGIVPCVEEWRLSGLPEGQGEDRIPPTPRSASNQLIGWLVAELSAIAFDEVEAPKSLPVP
jgi:hypothetical protein